MVFLVLHLPGLRSNFKIDVGMLATIAEIFAGVAVSISLINCARQLGENVLQLNIGLATKLHGTLALAYNCKYKWNILNEQ